MKQLIATLTAVVAASPALAATGPFLSLGNTNFVVMLAFILFIALLVYLKVPGKIGEMLDKRADGIKSELDEARALREEAQTLLASYERKQKEVQDQADRIVAHAKTEAAEAAEQAKKDLEQSIKRRIKAAEEQIASAEANAVKDVRDQAIAVAVAAAKDVVAKAMTEDDNSKLIDESIAQVDAKLH
ncbi:F0F1 ATP synthase subunit B [Roseovarius atlanticus]|uniref:F0F1 ATP synthase subunit B n=1 Tax=Roseovarius atlanticus TaxID=1641875 RepID=UPI001C977BDF|nr:F0F1 ATP synthase subunit B [Roseovarius atlanticus]MBY5986781.1 F0F1 ATP synthase subunit B [Roseovarius atlanticus]MBY6125421.1 F0F1 ATP synthase subunit B [Roseovarius atlanticus]MBY6150118.1 F0F1 ATP synthase subunit B [Roseovarius atlanticus]